MTNEGSKRFEDYIDVIEIAIRKQRSRWRLDCISWFDFEDVEQVIKLHIYNKWDMWDQKRPLEPWINIIVTLVRIFEPSKKCKVFFNSD